MCAFSKDNAIELLASELHQLMELSILPLFKEFVLANASTGWVIYSDYCVDVDNYPNDSFVFTLAADIDSLSTEAFLQRALPRDLKHTKTITADAITALTDPRFFTFAFVLKKKSALLPRNLITTSMNQSISMTSKWPKSNQQVTDFVKKLQSMRQSTSALSYNFKLFNHVVLTAALAGFIGTLLSRVGAVESLGWYPDRDAIQTKWDGVAYDLFFYNLELLLECCDLPQIDEVTIPAIEVNTAPEPFYDSWNRIPDFYAGPIANYSWVTNSSPKQIKSKYEEIIRHAVAGNSNVAVIGDSPKRR